MATPAAYALSCVNFRTAVSANDLAGLDTVNDHISRLENAVNRFSGCTSTFLETVSVAEHFHGFHGNVLWQRDVAVFALHGHAKAQRAYVWCEADDDASPNRYVVVLELPPINSARSAVAAAMAAAIANGTFKDHT